MLPTINDLNKGAVANDIGDAVSGMDEVVSIARTAANDTVDAVSKTMNRIMANHNGHQKRYRDSRGKFTTRQKAAANDKVDAVGQTMDRIMARHNAHDQVIPVPANDLPTPAELTMDRIMARHNGHDDAPGRMDAANENRVIHDYNPNVPQAEKKSPVLLESEENVPEILENDEKKETKSRRRKKESLEERDEIVPLLRSIETNTADTVDALHVLKDRVSDLSVENLKAREHGLEHDHGYIASSKDSISSMDQKGNSNGKDKEKPGFWSSLAGAATGLVTTGVVGAIGAAGSYFIPQTQKDNAGGFDGSQQAPSQKAPNRRGGKAPEAAPRPDVITGNVPVPKGQKAKMQAILFNAFKKQGYTDEGAKTMVAEIGRENGFRENLIFGTHIDPGNHALNMGMISWQGKRAQKLRKFLASKGLLDKNGNMIHSQATIEAQAEFLDMEMRSDKSMHKARNALFDKSKGYRDIEGLVGDDVIKWTRTHPARNMSYAQWKKIHDGGYHNQDQAYQEVSALLQKQMARKGTQLNQQSAQSNSKGNTVVVNAPKTNNTVVNANNQTPQQRNPRVPPPKSESWTDVVRDYFGF